ncbi:hypothetical protein ACN6LM_003739 [Streptomyces sp. SAS_281]|uniref:hypothetical protein n=1 Tax=Streptomyces sp. SAS_281 TaxID=3412744 RepID=UPI00403CE832
MGFVPDGRVLALLDPNNGAAWLPRGTPEPTDHADPETTLIREARKEAAAELAGTRYLGYLCPRRTLCARPLHRHPTSLGPTPVDPAIGPTYVQILATPKQALELFDWAPPTAEQFQAVH